MNGWIFILGKKWRLDTRRSENKKDLYQNTRKTTGSSIQANNRQQIISKLKKQQHIKQWQRSLVFVFLCGHQSYFCINSNVIKLINPWKQRLSSQKVTTTNSGGDMMPPASQVIWVSTTQYITHFLPLSLFFPKYKLMFCVVWMWYRLCLWYFFLFLDTCLHIELRLLRLPPWLFYCTSSNSR